MDKDNPVRARINQRSTLARSDPIDRVSLGPINGITTSKRVQSEAITVNATGTYLMLKQVPDGSAVIEN